MPLQICARQVRKDTERYSLDLTWFLKWLWAAPRYSLCSGLTEQHPYVYGNSEYRGKKKQRTHRRSENGADRNAGVIRELNP